MQKKLNSPLYSCTYFVCFFTLAGHDGYVILWDLRTGEKITSFYNSVSTLYSGNNPTLLFSYRTVCTCMCGFPLAEQQMQWKTFLAHSWESADECIGGVRSRGLYKVQLLFCHPPLPDMPHPPTHP